MRFLDLCAGTGAVGIEALSRGAAHATFVDRSRKICGLIEANLDHCGITEDKSEIFNAEAYDFLQQALSRELTPWEIVFFDPPYSTDYLRILRFLGRHSDKLVRENSLIVVEHYHKNQMPEDIEALHRVRTLKQGDSSLAFYNVQRLSD